MEQSNSEKSGIVHPGINVHFDITFLNDHCGKFYMGGTSNFFEMLKASMASFLIVRFHGNAPDF